METQAVVVQEPPAGPVAILADLVGKGASLEVLDRMKSLVEWDESRRAKASFNSAMAIARANFAKAKQSGFNAHLKVRYSKLEDYDDATRDALSAVGLSWRHVPSTIPSDKGPILSIRCIICHRDGHSEESEMQAPAWSMKNNAVNELQSTGIVSMYLKRMTLASMLGLVSDGDLDNDGNGGSTGAITGAQATQIHNAIIACAKAGKPVDLQRFLKWLGAESVETISANDFQKALQELTRKEGGK